MQRQLSARIDRLERNGGGRGEAFFLLWLRPGEDGEAAVRRERDARRDLAGVPVYVFKWTDDQPPLARWTTIDGVTDAEVGKMADGICEAAIRAGMDPKGGGPFDISYLTDRELVATAMEPLAVAPTAALPGAHLLPQREE